MSNVKEQIVVITKSRWLPWVLVAAIIVGGFFLYSHFNRIFKKDLTEQQQKFERQIFGQLTEFEKEKLCNTVVYRAQNKQKEVAWCQPQISNKCAT